MICEAHQDGETGVIWTCRCRLRRHLMAQVDLYSNPRSTASYILAAPLPVPQCNLLFIISLVHIALVFLN